MYKKSLGKTAMATIFAMVLSSTAVASECFESNVSGDNTSSKSGQAPGHSSGGDDYKQVRKAKLQIGNDSDTCFKAGGDGDEIGGVNAYHDHFWASSSGMTTYFEESGDSYRSELREEREFKVDDSGNDYIRTKARVISKTSDLEEVSIAQLHSEDSSGPVARLNWAAAGENTDVDGNSPEGIWLSIRQGPSCSSSSSSCFSHTFIGNHTSYKTYRLGLWGSKLRLSVNGAYQNLVREDIFDDDNDGNYSEKKTSNSIELNGSDWDGKNLYLKVGAYINSSGEARVGHRDIYFF